MMSEIKTFGYFVDNRWHKPVDGAYFESENPATGAVWARVADCRVADIDRAVAAAKRAFQCSNSCNSANLEGLFKLNLNDKMSLPLYPRVNKCTIAIFSNSDTKERWSL